MRTRTILLVVAILLVAGFAALNWPEIARSTPLSFGIFVTDAPLGAVTFSGGVSAHETGEVMGSAMGRADRLLYAAKDAGRNTIKSDGDIS